MFADGKKQPGSRLCSLQILSTGRLGLRARAPVTGTWCQRQDPLRLRRVPLPCEGQKLLHYLVSRVLVRFAPGSHPRRQLRSWLHQQEQPGSLGYQEEGSPPSRSLGSGSASRLLIPPLHLGSARSCDSPGRFCEHLLHGTTWGDRVASMPCASWRTMA